MTLVRVSGIAVGAVATLAVLGGCSDERVSTSAAAGPVFDADIAPLLQAHCVSCHGPTNPAAGWSATSFLATIACVEPSGAPATVPAASAKAPILFALASPPHVGLLSTAEQSLLGQWVSAGTPAFVGTVHPPSIVDPRSSAFHGAQLRSKHWSPMLDANDPEACGRCHAGTPTAVRGVTVAAPGAPDCTSCHSQPGGALACSTCHGSGTRAYPPRDPCFFPGDADGGTHAAHVEASMASASGVPCSTCHPTPDAGAGTAIIGGTDRTHGDGVLEVVFDPTRIVGGEASFDSATGGCAVGCHDLGGTSPRPLWTDTTPLDCNSCHLSPPKDHFPGACTSCHLEANATGTALTGGPLHMNGRVDLGNGNGTCGACHGTGASPWPTTAAHPAHENPTLSAPVDCASCHPVPAMLTSPGHLDGIVEVDFTGLAVARGASPTWNGTSCGQVACHGAVLPDTPAVVPVWTDDSGAALACTACHGFPPSQHTTSTSCNRSDCHGTEVILDSTGAASISASGRALHINGLIDR